MLKIAMVMVLTRRKEKTHVNPVIDANKARPITSFQFIILLVQQNSGVI